jgi:hypothetical protein
MSYKCQLYPTYTIATYIFVHSCHIYPQPFWIIQYYKDLRKRKEKRIVVYSFLLYFWRNAKWQFQFYLSIYICISFSIRQTSDAHYFKRIEIYLATTTQGSHLKAKNNVFNYDSIHQLHCSCPNQNVLTSSNLRRPKSPCIHLGNHLRPL